MERPYMNGPVNEIKQINLITDFNYYSKINYDYF